MKSKRALVISGGGAKAAYAVGALRHLIMEKERTYDIFCGNSAGAINAAALASNPDDKEAFLKLEAIWKEITPKSIFTPWGYNILGPIGGILLRKPSLYNSKPLQDIIDKNINRDDLISSGKVLTVGAVDLQTAEYKYWRETDKDIIEAIKASSAYPGAFLPVDIGGKKWVDAGLREFTPLSEAIYLGATEIDVIVLTHMQAPQFNLKKPNVLDMGKRALEIIMFRLDLWDLKVITCHYEGVTIRTLIPTVDLGSFINFDPENIEAMYKVGYEDAVNFAKKHF